MKDNLIFKIIRRFRKPHVQTIVHYSDGVTRVIGGENPNPLTRETKVEETFETKRSEKR
jgi:hypothetical protein